MKIILRFTYISAIAFSVAVAAHSPNGLKAQIGKKLFGKCDPVEKALQQAQITTSHFQGATRAINHSRDILFDIVAVSEQKEQLKGKEAELEQIQSEQDKERITVEIAEEKDRTIKEAHRSGQLQSLKLTGEQVSHVSRVLRNIQIAIKLDQKVIKGAPGVINNSRTAIGQSTTNLRCASKIKDLTKAIDNMSHIIAEAPRQVGTLTEFLTATMELANSNGVPEPGEPGDDPEVEDLQF